MVRLCEPGPEQCVNFSFRSVHFVCMKLQFNSIPYSPTIGHSDRSVRLVEFDQKVIEPFRPCCEQTKLMIVQPELRIFISVAVPPAIKVAL